MQDRCFLFFIVAKAGYINAENAGILLPVHKAERISYVKVTIMVFNLFWKKFIPFCGDTGNIAI